MLPKEEHGTERGAHNVTRLPKPTHQSGAPNHYRWKPLSLEHITKEGDAIEHKSADFKARAVTLHGFEL